MKREKLEASLKERLVRIYGSAGTDSSILPDLLNRIGEVKQAHRVTTGVKSEKDIILITYGDSIQTENEQPLKTLHKFLDNYLSDTITHVHILPFFPFSSDDGFSVIDYYLVDPQLGNWEDITAIAGNYGLMTDLVINHISQQSTWFQNFRSGSDPGRDYFIESDPAGDHTSVVRPRSLPLITPVETVEGIKHVWTTFSDDQIDLNFRNPKVLLEMLYVFLFYLSKGARIIRLDAIAFLWKEVGTSCLHLRPTHEVVKLMRDIIEYIDPEIILITETNVPNKENLSYFGNGDEANMVYQFSLPPLLLHALYTSNCNYFSAWASEISSIPEGCTYFNFTASHDGIGIRPLEGLLPTSEITELTNAIKLSGGRVNTRRNADGTDSPYELNITYLDALRRVRGQTDNLQVERFICSQTIMMSFRGIPAFYIHSLLGTHNYDEGVRLTGMARTINRRKWDTGKLYPMLEKESEHSRIMLELTGRIRIRKKIRAFHPDAPQEVLKETGPVFAMYRGINRELFVVANFSTGKQKFDFSGKIQRQENYLDHIQGKLIAKNGIELEPYQVMWIQKKNKTGIQPVPFPYY